MSAEEEQALLGNPPDSTFYGWKATREAKLSSDTLERISHMLGIYRALHILLPSAQAADEWIRKPNRAPLFGGRSALDCLLSGAADLAEVRSYLDAQREL